MSPSRVVYSHRRVDIVGRVLEVYPQFRRFRLALQLRSPLSFGSFSSQILKMRPLTFISLENSLARYSKSHPRGNQPPLRDLCHVAISHTLLRFLTA
jgi:hypothetical protein